MRHRLDAVRDAFDGFTVLTDRSDVRWASGFSGSSGWLVVGPQSATLVTDARYTERAIEESKDFGVDVLTVKSPSSIFSEVSRLTEGHVVGCRSASISHETWTNLTSHGIRLVEQDVTNLRRVKDPSEIETIARAAAIAAEALYETLPMIDVGVSERDIRDELDHRIRRLGGDGPSYDTIVAAGPTNSSIPHHAPSHHRLAEGEALVIDVGALVDGYHSDMTRTFFVGEVSDALAAWYKVLLEAQEAGLATVRAGVSARDVDSACRTTLGGDAEFFVHGTGHGVGLDIHEHPFLNQTSQATLAVGEVVTVEPGLYRRGFGGIRIEDLVVVRDESAEILTSFPKDLTCLPSRRTT